MNGTHFYTCVYTHVYAHWQLGILQIVYSQRIVERELMATLSLVTTWMAFGAKFAKVCV